MVATIFFLTGAFTAMGFRASVFCGTGFRAGAGVRVDADLRTGSSFRAGADFCTDADLRAAGFGGAVFLAGAVLLSGAAFRPETDFFRVLSFAAGLCFFDEDATFFPEDIRAIKLLPSFNNLDPVLYQLQLFAFYLQQFLQ
ncbi:MAG: hypothetical protein AB1724_04675 [Thermodesulfobacteriota bacterium]